jgi:hypothetical protein
MAHFDRYDICLAYLAVEQERSAEGWLRERPSSARRFEPVSVQLHRIGFCQGSRFRGYESLSENGRAIYKALCERLHLWQNP